MRILGKLAIGALCAAFSLAAQAATITSIAGGGAGGRYATRTNLVVPQAIAITDDGSIYVAEQTRIRRIAADGIVSNVAGNGRLGYGADGIAAGEASLNIPGAVAVDRSGTVYIADTYNQRVRKVGADGIIHTVAGNGVAGPAVDGFATASTLNYPGGLAIGRDGLLYIADTRNHVIRRLEADGRLVIVAGDGVAGFSGEGGPAIQARLSWPGGLAFDAGGALYLADTGNQRVRKIGTDGRIATVAGGGTDEASGDALAVKLRTPQGIAVDAGGTVYVTETDAHRVRKIKDGAIAAFAGVSYSAGFGGDRGEAGTAYLNRPQGVALDRDGNVYICDFYNNRIRRVALNGAGLPTVAGSRLLPEAVMRTPGRADDVEIGDVTGDGRDDIIVSTGRSAMPNAAVDLKVWVYAQKAGGGFADPVGASYYSDAIVPFSDLVLADLDRDGIADILVADRSGVSVFKGNRNADLSGTRYPAQSLGGASARVAVMDVNRDGKADVVHQLFDPSNEVEKDLRVLIGTGDGGLLPATVLDYTLPAGTSLAVGDISGDGIDDLVMTTRFNQAFVFEHNGVDGFKYEQYSGSSSNVDIGQFNGDARKELVVMYANAPNSAIAVRYYDGPEQIPMPSESYRSRVADLDGDRRDDLLVIRNGELAVYLQTDFGLSEEVAYPAPGIAQVAVGDLDGDGCNDVIALGNDGLRPFYGYGCVKPAPGDVDGNGKSDLLWRDAGQRNLAIWKMDGATRLEGIGRSVSPDWRVVATGDFQGDRKLDLVWTNGAQMQMWEGVGDGTFRGVAMRDYPAGWRVVAVGDANADGKTDLLWRDGSDTQAGLWVMDGVRIIDSAAYPTDRNWWVAGSGDLDGDRRMDVIWTDGTHMQLWRMTASLRVFGETMPAYPQGWELAATGDVTGDGAADLMWRHSELGHFAVWAMSGATRMYGVGYQPGPSWRVAQTGDFTGDGLTDIVWTNGSLMQLWQSRGDGFIGLPMPDYPLGWSTIRR